ncbi:hypothetical protein ACFQS7_27535 [Dankookia sp. GCM10030260]|uniref:hypothetical protein n=1 Tax=Dankookia sp. GCM10030260 TaxID=3273390 RepID=UPI00360EB9D3
MRLPGRPVIRRITGIRDGGHRHGDGDFRRVDMPMRQHTGQQQGGQKSKEAAGAEPEKSVQHCDTAEMARAAAVVKRRLVGMTRRPSARWPDQRRSALSVTMTVPPESAEVHTQRPVVQMAVVTTRIIAKTNI